MMDLEQLTQEQRNEIYAQMKADETRREEQKAAERKAYKDLASKAVDEAIEPLQRMSTELSALKMDIFKIFESLVDMKKDLYKVKSSQQSHTFSNADNTARITIGYRVLDRYDDTANEGITMVRDYMDSLAKDEDSAKLVKIINNLLKRDKQGNLKANRVVELQNFANEIGAKKLKEGVKIILQAHKPERSAYFVDADIKNGAGAWKPIPLSVSSANFPEEFEVNF